MTLISKNWLFSHNSAETSLDQPYVAYVGLEILSSSHPNLSFQSMEVTGLLHNTLL